MLRLQLCYTLSLFLLLSAITAMSQGLYISNESFMSSKTGIYKGDKAVVKPGRYAYIFETPNGFVAIKANKELDLLSLETAKPKKEINYAVPDNFFAALKPVAAYGRRNYEHHFYIVENRSTKKLALFDKQFNALSKFEFDQILFNRQHQAKYGPEQLIVVKDERYGIMDEYGTIMIEPQYLQLSKVAITGMQAPPIAFAVYEKDKLNVSNYVYKNGTTAHGMIALFGFNGDAKMTPYRYQEAIEYLLSRLDSLGATDKLALGLLYEQQKQPGGSDDAFYWYKTAFTTEKSIHTAEALSSFIEKNPVYLSSLEKDNSILDIWEYLASFNNKYSFQLGRSFAYGTHSSRNLEKAIAFLEQATVTSDNVLKDPIVFDSYEELVKLYHEKQDTKKKDYYQKLLASSGRMTDVLTGKPLAKSLKIGQVVLYHNQKAVVASRSFDAVLLTDGRQIPERSTDFIVLNESNQSYLKKCLVCNGSGKITKTYKNVYSYTPSFSKSEYIAGSSITGPKIKTTTTSPDHYRDIHIEGHCYRCNGSGKILPATELERR